mmetsp:Transcript_24997/g.63400  ORF Transcript_24997/g.63400 Transcript_24997/m.63400 type:complete len:228 (+) Transcript_24997:160-843(+)
MRARRKIAARASAAGAALACPLRTRLARPLRSPSFSEPSGRVSEDSGIYRESRPWRPFCEGRVWETSRLLPDSTGLLLDSTGRVRESKGRIRQPAQYLSNHSDAGHQAPVQHRSGLHPGLFPEIFPVSWRRISPARLLERERVPGRQSGKWEAGSRREGRRFAVRRLAAHLDVVDSGQVDVQRAVGGGGGCGGGLGGLGGGGGGDGGGGGGESAEAKRFGSCLPFEF